MKNHHQRFMIVTFSVLTILGGMTVPSQAEESTSQYVDDAALIAKVKEAIFADKQLKVMQVSADTDQATATLSGSVNTKADEDEALKVASLVSGVTAVTDHPSVNATQVDEHMDQ